MESIKKVLNTLLVGDVFAVLFFFAWLAIALLGEQWHTPLGWRLWQRLWTPVIQPALGLMMAGIILSALGQWIAKRMKTSDSQSR
ncbi:MAG: hypothetical protein HC919_03835 [Oscillatoriales cyanobacterium SM2_2_1]|nr:hypothetical protein [Oscillatoriales cyanobacterium SM2_2_1]